MTYNSKGVYLCYDPKKNRLGLSQAPYFFDIELEDYDLTESSQFRIKVAEDAYLFCEMTDSIMGQYNLDLKFRNYDPKCKKRFYFHLIKHDHPFNDMVTKEENRYERVKAVRSINEKSKCMEHDTPIKNLLDSCYTVIENLILNITNFPK